MPQRLLRAEKAPFCKVRRDSPSFLKNNFLFYVGVWLINNVVLDSSMMKSDSATHIHTSNLSKTFCISSLPHNIEQFSVLHSRFLLAIHPGYISVRINPMHILHLNLPPNFYWLFNNLIVY